jgi:hypothetical protein
VNALSALLLEAHKGGILSTSPQGGTGSLSLSIGQQLERAGLLHHLPAVITEAAEQLAELQDSDLIAAELMAATVGRQFAAQLKSSGLVGSGANVTVNKSTSQLAITHAHLDHLMTVLQMLGCLWSRDELLARVLPPLVLTLMQLLVQLLQHVSVYVSQLPDDLESAMPIMSLLAQANAVSGCIVAPVAHDILSDEPRFTPQQQQQQQQQRQQQQRQELLLSADASQAVCLLLVVAAYARMLHGQQSAGSGSSSSGSSRGSASSSAASSSRRSATTRATASYSIASSCAPFNSGDITSSSNNKTLIS